MDHKIQALGLNLYYGQFHALKDVSLFKLWTDLQRDTKPVDYSKMRHEVAATPQPDSACAGGACQTSYV